MWPSLCIVPITYARLQCHQVHIHCLLVCDTSLMRFFFYSHLVSLMKPNHVLVWLWDFQLTFKQTVPLFFWLEEHSGHILWRCRVNVMLSRSRSCRQLTPESLPPFCVPPTQCIPPFVQNSSFIPPFLPVFLLFLLLCHAISPLPPSLPPSHLILPL